MGCLAASRLPPRGACHCARNHAAQRGPFVCGAYTGALGTVSAGGLVGLAGSAQYAWRPGPPGLGGASKLAAATSCARSNGFQKRWRTATGGRYPPCPECLMTPRATMRLQLHAGFTLVQAAEQLDYIAAMGISHLYLSPITCARKGSTHGYDVTDPTRVDPELGGEDALHALAMAARARGMGLFLDLVPNHMAAHPDNPWWHSVLREGRASPYADWFDIQWDAGPAERQGKVLLPVLAEPYASAIRNGLVRLAHGDEQFHIDVQGMRLPVAAESLLPAGHFSVDEHLAAHEPSTAAGRQALHGLLERQHYRLAWWQCAGEQINWRRFFEVSDLVGLRVERDD